MDFSSLITNPVTTPFLADVQETSIGFGIFFYSAIVMIFVLAFAYIAKKGIRRNAVWVGAPALQAEHLYLFLENMAEQVIGKTGKKYVPFLLTLWTFIFVSNVFGLVFNQTPTGDWSLNISMAIITVFYVQYEGAKNNGVGGHLAHFSGPKMEGFLKYLVIVIFPIEIISELMKLFSLSIRLYGNIHGGHILVTSLNSLINILPLLGGLILPIKFFTCIIQAFVWVLLTCLYLSASVPHDDHESASDAVANDIRSLAV